jgi:hypothetical protein
MSTTLYWRHNVPLEGYSLPASLKYILGPRYYDHDGTLSGSDVILTHADVPYLEGVRDARADKELAAAAQVLLDVIAKDGSVIICIQ